MGQLPHIGSSCTAPLLLSYSLFKKQKTAELFNKVLTLLFPCLLIEFSLFQINNLEKQLEQRLKNLESFYKTNVKLKNECEVPVRLPGFSRYYPQRN